MKISPLIFATVIVLSLAIPASAIQPVVAIHDSELTRALESMPASGATPSGAGTTSNQWWTTQWHYFVMPDSVKEALRSDGTAYTVVNDAGIGAGTLLDAQGKPAYPIVISLAAEAVSDNEVAQLTNYVAAGGFLFVGSSSFTRNTNGTTRGDFAIANALGIHMVNPALTNWYADSTFSTAANHRLINHIPGGQLYWQMPSSAEENSWPAAVHLNNTTPNAIAPGLPHLLWQVSSSNATVIATGDANQPYLLVKQFGKGWFIYDAAMQPLLGHGGWAPGMYAYGIFKNAIQWAFESARLPLTKLSPWPYPYDAAVIFRHDMEAIPSTIISIENSAQFEYTNGAYGDYYFCTGTLRLDMPNPTMTNTIASLQRAMANYGATIGPHNGGLTNVSPIYQTLYNSPLVPLEPNLNTLLGEGWLTAFDPYTGPPLFPLNSNGTDYDYWHWGPDDILDMTNAIPGYANPRAYAFTSLSNSFNDIAGWRLTNGAPRTWVAPYFNATKEASYQIQQQLNIKATGDDKLSPFPHWVFSTQTPDAYYSMLSLPVSDWFIGSQVGQSMENGHTVATMQALVDYYYDLGALINLYCHSSSAGDGADGPLPGNYVTYSLSKPRVWSTNTVGVYSWWQQRSNAQITVNFSTNGNQSVTTVVIAGAGNTNQAVELYAPSAAYSGLQVLMNGALAGSNSYRTNGQTIKLLVGTSVTNAQVIYTLAPTAQDDFYSLQQGAAFTVAAPGILGNDTTASAGGTLTAALVAGPAHGSLSLNATTGGFVYTPATNFSGLDSFTYQAVDGPASSALATVTLMVIPAGNLFFDDFTRATNTAAIFPWVLQQGTWTVTNGVMLGSGAINDYGYVYYNGANWTNYAVQAKLQFSDATAWGGGIGGRLDPTTGAHYAAWVYPEGSGGAASGTAVLKLVKFTTWTTYTILQTTNLPLVSTNWHTVKLSMQDTNLTLSFDGVVSIRAVDSAPFTAGGISVDLATYPAAYTLGVDDVVVTPITTAPVAVNDNYNVPAGSTLTVAAPGVLGNDAGGAGALAAILVTGPANGTLALNANGGFSYTPTNNFSGTDSFTYRVNDGQTNSAAATVTITVAANRPPVANGDSFTVTANTALSVVSPGVLINDTDPEGNSLTAVLVTSPAHGTLVLNSNGGFNYTPAANYNGPDSFNYQANDGKTNSSPAAVTITVTAAAAAPSGILFSDDFTRTTNAGSLLPWVVQSGNWTVTNGVLRGGTNALQTYGFAYLTNSWTNFSVQEQVQLPAGAFGGGLGGRLNPTTGAHYAAWIYPEGSLGGSNVLKLVKFQTWTTWGYNNVSSVPMQSVNLAAVGTNTHTLKLAFSGSRIAVYFDGRLMMSMTDTEATPYLSGGISEDMWTQTPAYVMTVDNVVVSSPAVADNYNVNQGATLTVAPSGVLGNDTGIYGTNLTATLVSNAGNGALSLNPNGGFAYTPAPGFTGTDTFTYAASDGQTNLGTASVTITVNPVIGAPVITAQPVSQTSIAGTTASFSVSAGGSGLSYQWFKGAAAINGATLATLTLPGVSNVDAASYSVVVSNAFGSVTSSIVTLTVINPPTITSQPLSRTNNAGTLANFTVTASGGGLSYQWVKNLTNNLSDGGNISGANSAALSLTNVSSGDAALYSVIVSNAAGSVTSSGATLAVIALPVITSQPVSRTNSAGTTASFTVTASGSGLGYQWRKGAGNIGAATSATLTLTNVSAADATNYSVVVTNSAGSVTSSVVTLTVINPPAITGQPASRTNNVGTTASFTVTASGTGLSYQWLKNGTNNLSNGTNISGANTAALTLTNVALGDAGNYSVVVSNSAGSVTSLPAALVVLANSPQLFADDFTRPGTSTTLAPWVAQSGSWTVGSGLLRGLPSLLQTFASAYITNSWTNYSVSAQFQFPAGSYGGGLGGRLNRTTGAHYAAWIFPENSPGGSRVLKLMKFKTWTTWSYTNVSSAPMQQVTLAAVGTNWHTVKLAFSGNQIAVYFDTNLVINTTDVEATPYASGGVSLDMQAQLLSPKQMSVDNVVVSPVIPGPVPLALIQPAVQAVSVAPMIQSVVLNNGIASVSWDAQTGETYRLQFTDDLLSAKWVDVAPDVLATGATASANDSIGDTAQRFYRVLLLPTK